MNDLTLSMIELWRSVPGVTVDDPLSSTPFPFFMQEWLEGSAPNGRCLERAVTDAVKSEDYERAAKVRDELKNLNSADQ